MLRVDMQIELGRIRRGIGITTIFVTHDQQEALTLSDRLGIRRDGRRVQSGPTREVYDHPVDAFTAGFPGEAAGSRPNWWPGCICPPIRRGTALPPAPGPWPSPPVRRNPA